MSNHSTNEPTHIAYLWTRVDDELALREALFSAPRLPELRVQPYFDPATKTVFFRLRYRADESKRSDLRVWASIEGLRIAEPQNWSRARHLLFASELSGFRCEGDQGEDSESLLRLARQFEAIVGQGKCAERTVSGTLRNAVPTTIELSPSMESAVTAYLSGHTRSSDGVPQLMEITESMVVDVRMLSARVEMSAL